MKSSGLAYSFISSRGEQAMRDKQPHASPRLFPTPAFAQLFLCACLAQSLKVRAISAIVKSLVLGRRLLSAEVK
jgi:hypothetical protein